MGDNTQYLRQLLKTQKIQNVEMIETTAQVRWQNKVKMFQLALTIAFFSTVAIIVGYKVYTIRSKYKDMIKWVDSVHPAGYSGWQVALYFEYPHFPTNPFRDTAFPAAVVYSYYTEGWREIFTADKNNLGAMFTAAALGTNSPYAAADMPPLGIICHTWGKALPACELPCTNPTAPGGIASILQGGLSWGMNGAMMGGMTANPIAAGIGAVLGAGIGIGLGIWKAHEASKTCKKTTKHCIKPAGFSCDVVGNSGF